MVIVYNIGLAGFIVLEGYDPLKVSKMNGITFDISQEQLKEFRQKYFNSNYKRYNDILREIAKKFKSREEKK